MYRILFFGTSDFAVPSLKALVQDARFEVAGVITQSDKPVGRHAVLTAPPIKQYLVETASSIPVFQPEKLSDPAFRSWITEIAPTCDASVVIAYGKIIPQSIIDLAKKGIVNVHGSLLPRWRGAAPIQAAIAAGDTQSGVTVMLIDAKLDHGPILGVAESAILETDTGEVLHDRLAELGSHILPDILASYLEGEITPREQEHDLATECRTLSREDGKLDFSKTSQELERLIRAYTPWPGTWMMHEGKRIKIHEAKIGPFIEKEPGVVFLHNAEVLLSCAQGTSLKLVKIQKEGKTVQDAKTLTY